MKTLDTELSLVGFRDAPRENQNRKMMARVVGPWIVAVELVNKKDPDADGECARVSLWLNLPDGRCMKFPWRPVAMPWVALNQALHVTRVLGSLS